MQSIFYKGNYIDDRGYDVFPVKQLNGMYVAQVYKHEKFKQDAKKGYKTWQECRVDAIEIIYEYLKGKEGTKN